MYYEDEGFSEFYDLIASQASGDVNSFKDYLGTRLDLLWTEDETDDEIIITVEYFIDDEQVFTDLVGEFNFKKGSD